MKAKQNKIKIALIVSNYYKEISDGLLKGALKVLKNNKVKDTQITIVNCSGSFEIPQLVKKLCQKKTFDAVICLGAIIKGETAHFEYISSAVVNSIAQLNILYPIPIILGILTCYTYNQALRRSSDNELNKGAEASQTALYMIKLLKKF